MQQTVQLMSRSVRPTEHSVKPLVSTLAKWRLMCDHLPMMEVWTDSYPVTFDGLVVEAFCSGGGRWHVTQLVDMRLDEGRKGVRIARILTDRNGGVLGGAVPEQNWPAFFAMVAEVNRVRAERYGLPPVR